MAFCSKCGNHLEGKERFCVKCGVDLAAIPPAETPPASAAAPVAPVAQYAVPSGYALPGTVPMGIPIPVAAQKKLPWVWIVLTLVLAGLAAYYYYQVQTLQAEVAKYKPLIDFLNDTSKDGGNNNGGGGNDSGGAGGSGNNSGSPSLQQLQQQQTWQTTSWNVTNGDVLVQGTWDNASTSTLSTGNLVCTEYDANGNQLGTMPMHITGPFKPNTIYTWNANNPLHMGAPAANLDKLGCGVSSVTI